MKHKNDMELCVGLFLESLSVVLLYKLKKNLSTLNLLALEVLVLVFVIFRQNQVSSLYAKLS